MTLVRFSYFTDTTCSFAQVSDSTRMIGDQYSRAAERQAFRRRQGQGHDKLGQISCIHVAITEGHKHRSTILQFPTGSSGPA